MQDRKIRFSIWYVLIALMLMAALRSLIGGDLAAQDIEITYSEFKQAVRAEQVTSVLVGADEITGTRTDGSQFSAGSCRLC